MAGKVFATCKDRKKSFPTLLNINIFYGLKYIPRPPVRLRDHIEPCFGQRRQLVHLSGHLF